MPAVAIATWLLLLLSLSKSVAIANTRAHHYTLEELIEQALSHNGEADEAQWRVRGAEAQLSQARAAYFLPRLRLKSESGLVPDAKGDVFNPSSDTTGLRPLGPFNRTELEFVQPLYTFGWLSSLLRAAKGGLKVEQAAQVAVHLDIAFEIKELYYGILLAQDLQSLVRRLFAELDERQQELGDAVSLSSTFKLKLAVLELEKQEREIADRLELAHAALAWKTGLPPDQAVALASAELEPVQVNVPPLDSLFSQALFSRPDWRRLKAGIVAKAALSDAARSAYYPQIFLAGGVRYAVAPNRTDQHNPFVKDDFNFFNSGVFIGLRQSFEWGLMGAELDKARAAHLGLVAKKSGAVRGIRVDVQRAYLDFQQANFELKRARQKNKITRQWIKLAREDYEFEPGELRELINAFEAWAQAQQDYYEAIYNYNMSVAELAKSVGKISLSK